MRALVLHDSSQLGLREVADRDLAPGEIRVSVAFTGICGTDVRLLHGTKVIGYPRIIGHEFAGQVVEVTPEAGGWTAGLRVAVYPTISCGECYACRAGREHICINRQTIGYEIDGGFAEHVIVPAAAVSRGNVIALPAAVSDEEAALSESAAAALHGVQRARIQPGSQVLIFGAGPIGLAHAQLCRLAGASTIAIAEPQPARRAAALGLGIDAAIDPGTESIADRAREIFSDTGPDTAFVDVGLPALVPLAVGLLRHGGRCVLFAGTAAGATCPLEPNVIHYREVDLVGSSSSTPALHRYVLRMAADGDLNLRVLLSHVLPLDQWAKGFSMKGHGTGLKVPLDPASR